MGTVKNALKKILPPPVNSFMREVNRIVALEERNHETTKQLIDIINNQEKLLEKQSKKLENQERILFDNEKLLNEQLKTINMLSALSEQHTQKLLQQETALNKQENILNQNKQEITAKIESFEKQQMDSNTYYQDSVHELEENIMQKIITNNNDYNKALDALNATHQSSLKRIEQLQKDTTSLKNLIRYQDKHIIRQMPQPILEYFVLNILDHCNLRCKGCDHFAAIADKRFVALDDIKNDLDRMSELLNGQLVRMGIMGGEPLLHPDLLDILKLARYYFPNTLLQLVTNGLLLMQQPEEFWLTCHDNNIVIVNTKYPINLDYEGMIARANQYNVVFEHYGDTGMIQKTSNKIPLDLQGSQNARNSFLKCYHANALPLLMEGKFYSCTIAPNVKHFNKKFGTNLQVTHEDYVDIYQITDKKDIFEFLSKPIPFCRYCDVEHRQSGLEWDRSKQTIDEWTVV